MKQYALVAVKIPTVERTERDELNDKHIKSMIPQDDYFINISNGIPHTALTPFARVVSETVSKVLHKYDMYSDIAFKDCTDKIIYEYENDSVVSCVQWTNGLIEPCPWYFTVVNGVLKEIRKGKNRTPIRSHKAKRARYIGDIPVNKVFKSAKDFAYDKYAYVENKDTGEIGFWYNPDAIFEFYLIGDTTRPDAFIINSDADEYVFFDKDLSSNIIEDGDKKYRAVVGCRKKDLDIEATERLASDPFYYSFIIDDTGTCIDLLDEPEDVCIDRVKEYIKSLDDDYVILNVYFYV